RPPAATAPRSECDTARMVADWAATIKRVPPSTKPGCAHTSRAALDEACQDRVVHVCVHRAERRVESLPLAVGGGVAAGLGACGIVRHDQAPTGSTSRIRRAMRTSSQVAVFQPGFRSSAAG